MFYALCEEMREIEIQEALALLFQLFAPVAAEELNVDKELVDSVIEKFLSTLPSYAVRNLRKCS